MSKAYNEPNIEIVKIAVEDVITTSNPGIDLGENETPEGGGL